MSALLKIDLHSNTLRHPTKTFAGTSTYEIESGRASQ